MRPRPNRPREFQRVRGMHFHAARPTAGGGGPALPEGRELLYGRQPVRECLLAGRRVAHALWLSARMKATPEMDEMRALARSRAVRIAELEPALMDTRLGGTNHQGVALETGPYPFAPVDELLDAGGGAPCAGVILLLDHIQDPQNVGALLRTAEGAGVRGVIIPADRACGITPAVVRASAGASEHVRVAVATNLVRAMNHLREEGGFRLAGLEALPEAATCWEADLSAPLGLVVGGEGAGLGRLVRETCDLLVKLPMRGRVASLNVSVATGMALYEIARQAGGAPAGVTRGPAAAGSA